jgi:c-di-GMP-binding flagellar brake protein YcgR
MSTQATATGLAVSQRRKDRRFKQWNKASIKALPDHLYTPGRSGAEAFTYDLSLGGARIQSREPFEVGSQLSLRLELVRSSETVTIEGEVKWARLIESENIYEMGVAFNHSTSQTVMSLMKNLHDSKR